MRSILVLLTLGFLLGCSRNPTASFAGRCLAPVSIAVIVAVDDSVSGASVVDSARGVAQAGAYVDSLHLSSPPPVLLGGDRLGTYEVTVTRPGYRQWTRSGVLVSQQGPCGNVIPVQLTALLQRAP